MISMEDAKSLFRRWNESGALLSITLSLKGTSVQEFKSEIIAVFSEYVLFRGDTPLAGSWLALKNARFEHDAPTTVEEREKFVSFLTISWPDANNCAIYEISMSTSRIPKRR